MNFPPKLLSQSASICLFVLQCGLNASANVFNTLLCLQIVYIQFGDAAAVGDLHLLPQQRKLAFVSRVKLLCVCVLLQEQQQLLSAYQSLVVKQLVSQSQGRKQEEAGGEADEAGEQDQEARSIRAQLMALTPQVKDLVLSQKKTSLTED